MRIIARRYYNYGNLMMNKDDLLKQKEQYIKQLIPGNPEGVKALQNSGATSDGLKELSSGNLAFLLSSKEDVIRLRNSGVMFDTLKELDLEKTRLLFSCPKNVGKLIQYGFTCNDLKELEINF